MTQTTIKQETPDSTNRSKEVYFTDILQEIQATPREYWSNLWQIIRSFRQAITSREEILLNSSTNSKIESDESEQINKNQAVLELLRQWREEGHEEEQTETWEFLRKALDLN